MDEKDNIILTAPWGIRDVIHLEVKPTPFFLEILLTSNITGS